MVMLDSFEEKLASGTAEITDMLQAAGPTLQLITSVTFGGPICAPLTSAPSA
jgi:gluconolactonase